jgi:hypothetical protein
MNIQARMATHTCIPTGDQAVTVRHALFFTGETRQALKSSQNAVLKHSEAYSVA